MTRAHKHNWLTYRMEMSVIRVRDLIRPPARVLLNVGVKTGMTVLDFGCGPGGFSLAAARIVEPEGLVYALDVQQAALESVRRAAIRRGISNLHPIPADQVSQVPEESVDIALLYDVLHIVIEPVATREILLSIHRVLKPDGVLSVSDHHLQEASLLTKVTGSGLYRPAGHIAGVFQFKKIPVREAKP
ncbi:MAG TPA: methyltransferase domain-containing protein [Sedimentisphaerales bacterium]|nr:methyltransferase domain-containing protein [Sedimentisphaerales bacterium]HNU31217.1 methyltransferase domain-containing protein [Sedimentisphaerales bacterium]